MQACEKHGKVYEDRKYCDKSRIILLSFRKNGN